MDSMVMLAIVNAVTGRRLSALKSVQTIGDGVATSFTVAHNRNSQSASVTVQSNEATPPIMRSLTLPDANTAQIVFDRAPLPGSIRVVVFV